MNPLVGTWRLVSGELRDARGQLRVRFVHGVIRYTPNGLVSARCTVAETEPEAGSPPDRPPDLTRYAYSGSYEACPQERVVVHHLAESTIAEEEGSRVVRSYEIADGRLILRFPGIEPGPAGGAEDEMSGFIVLELEEPPCPKTST
jgi:lipocalin-like protein